MSERKKTSLATRAEILLIEDDPQIRKFVKAMLTAEDYRLYEAVAAEDGLAQAASRSPDLILLDLGLPDRDGLQVIEQIRQWSHIPIVVLSARGGERDKIKALDAGADDYVSKPFAPGELSARIRASLRRAWLIEREDSDGNLVFGNISVNLVARRVLVAGLDVHLTPNEYKLLQVLLRHAGRVVTQRQLLKEVWGPEHLEEPQYLRVFMKQLREKLESDPTRPTMLATVVRVGYRFNPGD